MCRPCVYSTLHISWALTLSLLPFLRNGAPQPKCPGLTLEILQLLKHTLCQTSSTKVWSFCLTVSISQGHATVVKAFNVLCYMLHLIIQSTGEDKTFKTINILNTLSPSLAHPSLESPLWGTIWVQESRQSVPCLMHTITWWVTSSS